MSWSRSKGRLYMYARSRKKPASTLSLDAIIIPIRRIRSLRSARNEINRCMTLGDRRGVIPFCQQKTLAPHVVSNSVR